MHISFKNLAVLAAVASLSACVNDTNPKYGQALVKVDKEEITVHQLNNELQYVATQTASLDVKKLQDHVLQSLVTRQLLVAEAVKNKMDRDLEILQKLERARAQSLAEAYLQRFVTGIAKPTPADITAYFSSHPELFLHRKLFELKQVSIAEKDVTPVVKSMVEAVTSLGELTAWFDANKIPYIKDLTSRSTVDLSPTIVSQISTLEKGVPFMFKDGNNMVVASMSVLKEIPISLKMATPEIESFLTNDRVQKEIEEEIERLRKNAKIVFYHAAANATNQVEMPAVAPPEAPLVESGGLDKNHIDLGVKGLK